MALKLIRKLFVLLMFIVLLFFVSKYHEGRILPRGYQISMIRVETMQRIEQGVDRICPNGERPILALQSSE